MLSKSYGSPRELTSPGSILRKLYSWPGEQRLRFTIHTHTHKEIYIYVGAKISFTGKQMHKSPLRCLNLTVECEDTCSKNKLRSGLVLTFDLTHVRLSWGAAECVRRKKSEIWDLKNKPKCILGSESHLAGCYPGWWSRDHHGRAACARARSRWRDPIHAPRCQICHSSCLWR